MTYPLEPIERPEPAALPLEPPPQQRGGAAPDSECALPPLTEAQARLFDACLASRGNLLRTALSLGRSAADVLDELRAEPLRSYVAAAQAMDDECRRLGALDTLQDVHETSPDLTERRLAAMAVLRALKDPSPRPRRSTSPTPGGPHPDSRPASPAGPRHARSPVSPVPHAADEPNDPHEPHQARTAQRAPQAHAAPRPAASAHHPAVPTDTAVATDVPPRPPQTAVPQPAPCPPSSCATPSSRAPAELRRILLPLARPYGDQPAPSPRSLRALAAPARPPYDTS